MLNCDFGEANVIAAGSEMETEELIKLVDGIYKNILDKFNPGARQMINAGKAYLKALHGAAAASRLYVDAISKLARQAQQGTWGGCSDIGAALMKVVEVYKEIHDQQMNILKAFYVDLLVPLETNLEKDTKVVQSEQKRFLQLHKQRSETYSKAAATIKKQRKKSKGTTKGGLAMDRELKNMQVLEEEKTKLDAFCEQSLKNAMTQERRRYGFVLERHCSLSKHYVSYHNQGAAVYQQNLEKWQEVAKTREFLPESVENIFSTKIRQVSIWQDDDLYSDPRNSRYDDDRISLNSQLRKTKSMDASCLDVRSIQDISSPVTTLSRAKSEFNVNSSITSLVQDQHTPTRTRPKSMAVPPIPPPQWETQLARALYAYLSSGDNQLSFLEGDVIALMGERNKGWQFGENLRTQLTGWFPLAYTELLIDDANLFSSPKGTGANHQNSIQPAGTVTPLSPNGLSANANLESPSPRMFGDTLHLHRSSANAKQIRRAIASNNIPPPALPAPVPSPSLPYNKSGISQSQSTHFNHSKPEMDMTTFQTPAGIRTSTSTFSFTKPSTLNPLPIHLQTKGGKIGGPVGNVSLHSSNDSGFSNDPPPQPEIDYSDDESIHTQTKASNKQTKLQNNNKTVVRPSVISSNLGFSDDQSVILKEERKGFVKRTKSFWKFGKSGSDIEVLEGMALWKHRDLVDITKEQLRRKIERTRKLSSDSERTLNAIQFETNAQPEIETNSKSVVEDEFYDHEDGLLMRTVNRKEILQKYNGDTTGSDSESENEVVPTEDPYDCIVVKDQTQKVRKNEERTNVAAIGKKLEKLSKSSKYLPEKEKSTIELKNEKNRTNTLENNNVIKYSDRNEQTYSFQTFKSDDQSNTNTVKKQKRENKNRNNRRYYNDENSQIRSSYESINSETTAKQSNYDERIRDNSADDEFSDAVENRQFLPRTKLSKTNSNSSNKVHDESIYNDSVKKKQDRASRSNRNTYGPWYDLWGLDASVQK